ncbi:MAG: DUF5615 family PIN-like protein [Candidatus Riflebacteria bacterium]|nr:DUF5615 family PIN-like protein [Candidatus Riflebacteria bacterium]
MKLKIDENLPLEIIEILRQYGHEAHSVYDEKMQGSKDAQLIAVCRSEKRVLITLDLDFSDIRTYSPSENSGIIVLRLKQQDKPFILDMIQRLCRIFPAEGINGVLWIVDEKKIRIRE